MQVHALKVSQEVYMQVKRLALTFTMGLLILSITQTSSASPVTEKLLKKYDLKKIKCPDYIAHMGSGLTTSILKSKTFCLKSKRLGKLKKRLVKGKLVIDGTHDRGEAFDPVDRQEGDVNTNPFRIANYPAIIHYQLRNAAIKKPFTMSMADPQTGKVDRSFYRVLAKAVTDPYAEDPYESDYVEGLEWSGSVIWNNPGEHFLKLKALPYVYKEDGETYEVQPEFSASISFMEEYIGERVSKGDMRFAEVKARKCPKLIIDADTGKYFKVGNKFTCTKKVTADDMEMAGFTIAPFNLGKEVFMARDIEIEITGDSQTFPFRVEDIRWMDYSVDDLSNGKASVNMSLRNFSNCKIVDRSLVSVKGNISYTRTALNIPGDYVLEVAAGAGGDFGDPTTSVDIMSW